MDKLRKENKKHLKEIQRLKNLNKKLTSELSSAKKKLNEASGANVEPFSDLNDNSDSDIEIIELVDGYEDFSEKKIQTFKKLKMLAEVDLQKLSVDDPQEFVAKVSIHKDKIKVRLPKKKKADENKINNESIEIIDLDDSESDSGFPDKTKKRQTKTKTSKVAKVAGKLGSANKRKTTRGRTKIAKANSDSDDDFVDTLSTTKPKRRQTKALNLVEIDSDATSDSDFISKSKTKRRRTKTPKTTASKGTRGRPPRNRSSLSASLTGRLSPGRANLEESDEELLNFRSDSPACGNIKKLLDAGKQLENKIKRGADIPDVVLLI